MISQVLIQFALPAATASGVASASLDASNFESAVQSPPVASSQPQPVSVAPSSGDASSDTYQRVGGVTALNLGMSSCGQLACTLQGDTSDAHIGIGPTLGMDFGLRPRKSFDVTGGFTFSYLPVVKADEGRYANGWYSIHAIGRYFPIKQGRWDPYVGGGIGFTQFWSWSKLGGSDTVASFTQFNLLLVAGFDFHVNRAFSLGPRFTKHYGVGGKTCAWVEDSDKMCISRSEVSEVEENDERLFPRPWEIGVAFKWRMGGS